MSQPRRWCGIEAIRLCTKLSYDRVERRAKLIRGRGKAIIGMNEDWITATLQSFSFEVLTPVTGTDAEAALIGKHPGALGVRQELSNGTWAVMLLGFGPNVKWKHAIVFSGGRYRDNRHLNWRPARKLNRLARIEQVLCPYPKEKIPGELSILKYAGNPTALEA